MTIEELRAYQCRGAGDATQFFYIEKLAEDRHRVMKKWANTDDEVKAAENKDNFVRWLDDDELMKVYQALAWRQFKVGG